MTYLGAERAQAHRQPPIEAVVLVNLGTPDAPTPSALRRYLGDFLSDRRVIEIPRWLWWLILNGVILRIRPARSARAYARIWTEAGSPLRVGSEALTAAVGASLAQVRPGTEVHLAMSYGQPPLRVVLEDLRARGLRRLLLLPLYPQYSGSTSASVFDAVASILQTWRWQPELRVIGDYYREPGYVEALRDSVLEHWTVHGRARLLLSFHGIPQRYVNAGDPYFCQSQATARLLREALGLSPDELFVSFQSRVGREEWLRPYTDELLQSWARSGVKRVQVLCPGFAVDCLETLDEIAREADEHFRAAGGERLEYIAALNARPAHVAMLTQLIVRHCGGWASAAEGAHIVAERQAHIAAFDANSDV